MLKFLLICLLIANKSFIITKDRNKFDIEKCGIEKTCNLNIYSIQLWWVVFLLVKNLTSLFPTNVCVYSPPHRKLGVYGASELTLLQTPKVLKKTPTRKRQSIANANTPQSILKVKQIISPNAPVLDMSKGKSSPTCLIDGQQEWSLYSKVVNLYF